jgi:hypothetical protein
VAATVDEGNNYVSLRYGPLYTAKPTSADGTAYVDFGDYHIASTSPAKDTGLTLANVTRDFDGDLRPQSTAYDIGADEYMVPAPVIGANSPVAFGNQSLNTSVTKSLTVTNIGIGPLLLTTTTFGGANADQFTFTIGTCPVSPAALATGASCNMSVTFRPTSNGNKSATLTVNASNAASVVVSLTGTGVTPAYTINPVTGHGFGNQQVGSQSAPFQFTLTNSGLSQGNLLITGNPTRSAPIFVTNQSSQFQAAYLAGDSCAIGVSLAPNGSCTFSVVFAPTSTGSKGTSALTPGSLVNVPVASGAGAASPVWGTGVQAAVTFSGTTALTTGTANRNVKNAITTITNSGTAPLVISSITIAVNTGQTNPGTYRVDNPGTGSPACPIGGTELAAGASCQITVTYTPPAGALNTIGGTLTVTDAGAAAASQTRGYTGN